MSRLALWCFRHRLSVLLGWLVTLGVVVTGATAAGTAYTADYTLPSTDSGQAMQVLAREFPGSAGDTATVVWQVPAGSVREPEIQARITDLLDDIATVAHVSSVSGPYRADDPSAVARISADGRTAIAEVTFDVTRSDLTADDIAPILQKVAAARSHDLLIEAGGAMIAVTEQSPPGLSEGIGLLAAGIVLFIAFGSLLAMTLPLLTAMLALGVGFGSIVLLSHLFGIADTAPALGTLVGLGVGIDYALFIVHRYRAALRTGAGPADAVATAMDTAGRAVLFAGATVCSALLAILLLGIGFLNGLAIAATLMVAFSMLGAVTLLPALLGYYGTRIRGSRTASASDTASVRGDRWARCVQRWPKTLACAAVAVMVALSLPATTLRLGTADAGNGSADQSTRRAYDLIAAGFGPGANGPLLVVAELHSPTDDAALTAFAHSLDSLPGVAARTPPRKNPIGTVALIRIIPATAPQDPATDDLIAHLRTHNMIAAETGSTLDLHLGGSTAVFADFAETLTAAMPLFIATIVLMGAMLLMLAFRSVLIPLTAAAMNLLAATASFGVLTAVFQHDIGLDLIGGYAAGPIEPFIPMIMIAVLFGLSMDYQVFLVTAIRERWLHSGDNGSAVRYGQADTARVINAAATIMVSVFLAFLLTGERILAEFGIGLAAAVLLDAFVLRMALVPATMTLLGTANWWLPRWLDRTLPHLSIEPTRARTIQVSPVVRNEIDSCPSSLPRE